MTSPPTTVPGETTRDHGYWRDVGTIDAYHAAHMDLVAVEPIFNLYNRKWPLLTGHTVLPPAKVVFGGSVKDSLLANGVIVSGGRAQQSVLSPGVRIAEGARVENSVLLNGVEVGPGAILRNVILDKNVKIGPGVRLGGDRAADEARGCTVSPDGVTVLGKAMSIY